MMRTTRLLAIPLMAAGLLFAANITEAQAQGIRVQIGGFGVNGGGYYRGGYNAYSHRSYGYSACPPAYGYQSFYGSPYGNYGGYHGYHGSHRGAAHFDYHPPQVYRHGNHYDFQPGHYDLHRSGHHH